MWTKRRECERALLGLFLFLLLITTPVEGAKNVILFVGDAAGVATVHGATAYDQGRGIGLYIHSMPNLALVDTATASQWVADSAASATALATGRRTHNGVIAQSSTAVRREKDGAPLKTILEHAEERGLATGVVSNSSVLSATPAVFYAHTNDRSNEAQIFDQLLKPRFGDGVDAVIGGGLDDVVQAAAALGIEADSALERRRLRRYPSLGEVPLDAQSGAVLFDGGDFDLVAATETAIRMLSRNEEGFFLLVESDCHTESVVQGLQRVLALDSAIKRSAAILDPEETLILFTADHSYDFRIHDGRLEEPLLPPGTPADLGDDLQRIETDNIRRDDDHTGEYVILTGQGPGAERVKGFLHQTEIFDIMMAAYGWE